VPQAGLARGGRPGVLIIRACVATRPIPPSVFIEDGMEWTIPRYRPVEVNEAGRVLLKARSEGADSDELDRAFDVISNWRSSHSFPLNTFQVGLRHKARQVHAQSLVAQRLKRLKSITDKLERMPDLRLNGMQDIAGCRAIVATVSQVDALLRLYEKSDIKHKLVKKNDYIRQPKSSGYRSVHLIYAVLQRQEDENL